MARFKALLYLLVLLDILHLRLHFLEDDPQLLGLQGNDLIVIGDFFNVLNLLSLCLLLHTHYLIFQFSFLGEFIDHLGNDFVTISG
jgi:hypothetical protein